MPILFSKKLPATKILQKKGIFVMDIDRAEHQDIRPLRIAILNLMPKKEDTEAQLLRSIGSGPLQIYPTFISLDSYTPKNISPSHLENFYKKFSTLSHEKFDGLIITGSPVEHLEFEEVAYWEEIQKIFDWAKTNVTSRLFICWAAQAALYHYYNIEKQPLEKKCFGVFTHTHSHNSPLLQGLDDFFTIPISRHTTVKDADILSNNLINLAASRDTGIAIASNQNESEIFSFGHLEYDRTTLADEYYRDIQKKKKISVPYNYFPNDDDTQIPILSWRANSEIFFRNWVNTIYQKTPYKLE